MNIAIFASGNGTDMQAIVDGCKQKLINANVVAVISNNKDAFVLQRAKKENIPYYYIAKENFDSNEAFVDDILRVLKLHKTDMIFLAGYLKMFPSRVIEAYNGNVYNIHPALLPKFGGKGMFGINVHRAVLEANEKETGITIHKVNTEYDKGEIVAQTTVPVLSGDTPETLAARVLEREHTFLVEILSKIVKRKNS